MSNPADDLYDKIDRLEKKVKSQAAKLKKKNQSKLQLKVRMSGKCDKCGTEFTDCTEIGR